MSCIITRPDPQELFDHLKNMFSSTVLGGGKIYPESNEWYVVSNDYAAAEQFYAIADQMWRETDPATACCENLYKMAAQHGMYPKPASSAEGYARVFGTVGAAVPPSLEIQTTVGTFVSVGTVPLTIPSSGSVVIRIRSLTPGATYNAAGEITTGTLTTPAPGIEPEVVICGGTFCGGAEAEDCEAFRKRYLERLAYQPKATMAWIQAKLMEWPCATRVCIREGSCCRCTPECAEGCGCKNCGNSMEFYVMFDGVFPCGIPPVSLVEDITDWLFGEHQGYGEGQVEIGVCGKIYVPLPLMVDVVIDIEGCPSSTQKQIISDQITALFQRICPSMKLCAKQLELIAASVIGADINVQIRFEVVGHVTERGWVEQDGARAWLDHCCIEPECDVLPCLNEITFVNPDMRKPPC
jgi:hypothetical protein